MAFRSAGTATSGAIATSSLTPGSPAGLAANDIIIVVVTGDASGNTYTYASGFTALYPSTAISTPDGQTMGVGWKRAVGGDTLTVTRSTTGVSWVVQAFCWSGRDVTNPPVASTLASNSASNASPTTITANGVTAVLNDDLFWLGILDVTSSGASSLTQPTGYTSRATTADTVDGFNIFGAATKDAVAAGATGTVAGSMTHSGTSGWFAGLIRIPAASGTSYDSSLALALSTLLESAFSWYQGAFEATAFETTAFFTYSSGNSYPEAVAFALTMALVDNYQLALNPAATLPIATVDASTGQLNGIASVTLSTLMASALVGTLQTSKSVSLPLATALGAAQTLGINAAEQLAAALGFVDLAGFTFSASTQLSATLAQVTASAFSFFGTAAFSTTTAISSTAAFTASGLLTLGIAAGYSLARSLTAIGAANFAVTAGDVAGAAGSIFGGAVPLPLHTQVTAISAALMNALMSAGATLSTATAAANLVERAIAFGIATALAGNGDKNTLVLAALVAESLTVIQALSAEGVLNLQSVGADGVLKLETLAAEAASILQSLWAQAADAELDITSESITDIQ
jgi:hypothetical protein